jgi:hypothetical protein
MLVTLQPQLSPVVALLCAAIHAGDAAPCAILQQANAVAGDEGPGPAEARRAP